MFLHTVSESLRQVCLVEWKTPGINEVKTKYCAACVLLRSISSAGYFFVPVHIKGLFWQAVFIAWAPEGTKSQDSLFQKVQSSQRSGLLWVSCWWKSLQKKKPTTMYLALALLSFPNFGACDVIPWLSHWAFRKNHFQRNVCGRSLWQGSQRCSAKCMVSNVHGLPIFNWPCCTKLMKLVFTCRNEHVSRRPNCHLWFCIVQENQKQNLLFGAKRQLFFGANRHVLFENAVWFVFVVSCLTWFFFSIFLSSQQPTMDTTTNTPETTNPKLINYGNPKAKETLQFSLTKTEDVKKHGVLLYVVTSVWCLWFCVLLSKQSGDCWFGLSEFWRG